MGKQCCVCNSDIGMFGAAGLRDGKPICRDCYNKTKNEVKEVYDAGNEVKSERNSLLYARTAQYKPLWDKNGIIQFKNERIAILKRQVGAQVEFIIAFDDLTNEGYELKAIDEGKSADVGGISTGASSYYYFQKR